MTLTPKQSTFVDEYLLDLNCTQAAIRAGYSKRTAYSQGQRLLKNVEVRRHLEAALKARSERTQVDADMVIDELRKIGFADIRQMFSGDSLIDINNLGDDIAAAVQSVEVVTRPGGLDENGERTVEYVHKIRLADKRAALVDLGKHLDLFPTRQEHTGKHGGPIRFEDVAQMTDEQLTEELERIWATARGGKDPELPTKRGS